MDITVRPIEGMELSELLKEAVSNIQGTYQAVELPESDKGKEIETIPATPDVKNLSLIHILRSCWRSTPIRRDSH